MARNVTVLPTAARTAAQTSPAVGMERSENSAHVIIDVTAITHTPVLTPTIQGFDPTSSKWYDILVATPISTVGTTVLKVGPGLGAIVGATAADILPQQWRVSIAVADTDSATYSVGVAVG